MNWKDYLDDIESEVTEMRDDLENVLDRLMDLRSEWEEVEAGEERFADTTTGDIEYEIESVMYLSREMQKIWIKALDNADTDFKTMLAERSYE
jgi:hypothetical protein